MRLSKQDERTVAALIERDIDEDLSLANIQRVLEGAAIQSRGESIFKRASYGSDASLKRIVAEIRAIRQERIDLAGMAR